MLNTHLVSYFLRILGSQKLYFEARRLCPLARSTSRSTRPLISPCRATAQSDRHAADPAERSFAIARPEMSGYRGLGRDGLPPRH